jgi:GNAT superfamily N-acetyltransferase
MNIRAFQADDDVVALTEMLHRAYAPLAAAGLRYNASHQPPEKTALRMSRGATFVAEIQGRIVGTITVCGPDPKSGTPVYSEPSTYHFEQFGVDPDFKRKGIGRELHSAAVALATRRGARFMALDTAAPAKELIATYERWGYVIVDRKRWDSTNYESVLMRRPLGNKPNHRSDPSLASVTSRAGHEPRLP